MIFPVPLLLFHSSQNNIFSGKTSLSKQSFSLNFSLKSSRCNSIPRRRVKQNVLNTVVSLYCWLECPLKDLACRDPYYWTHSSFFELTSGKRAYSASVLTPVSMTMGEAGTSLMRGNDAANYITYTKPFLPTKIILKILSEKIDKKRRGNRRYFINFKIALIIITITTLFDFNILK